MSANQIKVRRKQSIASNRKNIKVFLVAAAVILLGIGAAFGVAKFSDKFSFSAASTEIIREGNRNVIRVPAGGDVQAAIAKARGGDTIELQAGATYYGEIKLPNKPINDFITIQTSAAARLSANRRVNPSQTNLMAKIVSRGKGAPALSAGDGAHHFRFVGIEFAPENSDYVYNLVLLGGGEKKTADVPHDFEFDRCYFHPYKTGVTRRGIALNSANTIIKNSYLEGFAFAGEETQAICGWTGTKNVKITNNRVEGGAENIMFGGADPSSADLTPSDIEVTQNLLIKPLEWRGKYTLKTLFELKNAKRVVFTENYLEHTEGSAFRITVRNQDGSAPFSTIEDVLIKNNIVSKAGEGVNVLGRDNPNPSQTAKRIKIINNLFLDIDGGKYGGRGLFILIAGGEDIEFANNTVFNTGNTLSAYGEATKNLLVRDNIIAYNDYGIHAEDFLKSKEAYARYFAAAFRNNLIVNTHNLPNGEVYLPANNLKVNAYRDIGFANFDSRDFRLAPNSRYKGKSSTSGDIGCDVAAIQAKMPKELYEQISK